MVGFGLVCGEVLVRLVAPQSSSFTGVGLFVMDDELGYRLRPDLHQPANDDHAEIAINGHGLRDEERPWEKPAGTRRVLVLGDSFAFTSGPADTGFCAALERELGEGVDVINSGVPGWTTTQQAIYLARDGLRYDPDVIVVACFVGNDVAENLGQSVEVVDNELVAKQDDGEDGRSWRKRVMRKSHLYRVLRGLPEAVFYRLIGDSVEARRYHKIERRRLAVCLREPADGWDQAWQITHDQLARIAELAGDRPRVLFLIPDEFQVDPSLREAVLARYEIDPAGYDWGLPQRRLGAWGEALGFQVVDPLPTMRERHEALVAAGTPEGGALYTPFDSHWNARGNALAGELLAGAPALKSLKGLQDNE